MGGDHFPFANPTPPPMRKLEKSRLDSAFSPGQRKGRGEAPRPQAALEPHSNLYSTHSCPKPQMGHGLLSPGR